MLAVVAAILLFIQPSHAQFDAQRQYRRSDAVLKRYPDPALRFDTPGFIAGRSDFTSHQEMLDFVYARRVDTLVHAMQSLLTTTADNAAQVLRTVHDARADLVRRGQQPAADDRLAVTVQRALQKQRLTMIDPQCFRWRSPMPT